MMRALLAAALFLASSHAFAATELLIGAAASLKDALEKLKPAYEAAHPGVKLSLNLAASSAVARQIKAKAPVDVFFSADEDNMDALAKDGLIDAATRQDIVGNELVLVAPAASKFTALADLTKAEVKAIALCDSSVPVGGYARQWLAKAGLAAKIGAKVVKPDNVRAALALVASGSADAGFVYATDLGAANGKAKIVARPVPADGINVRYPAAVVKATSHAAEAQAFVAYLRSDAAQKVFKELGFTAP